MDTSFTEEHAEMEMVQITLLKMGLDPTVSEIRDGGPLLVSASISEEGGEIGSYWFNSTEPQSGEITFLFTTTVGELKGELFLKLVQFLNLIHGQLMPPGVLYLAQSNPESSEWFLNHRLIFSTEHLPREVLGECIEENFFMLDEFFVQARWAIYELVTGGDIEQALEMLSIGETRAQA